MEARTLGGALEARTLHSTFEGLALGHKHCIELGSNPYPHITPASPGAHERLSAGLRWPRAADLRWLRTATGLGEPRTAGCLSPQTAGLGEPRTAASISRDRWAWVSRGWSCRFSANGCDFHAAVGKNVQKQKENITNSKLLKKKITDPKF